MAGDRTSNEVPPDPKQWRSYTAQQRGSLIKQMSITHFRLFPGFEELESIDARTRDPVIRTPYSLLPLYNAGAGKTVAAQHWMKT